MASVVRVRAVVVASVSAVIAVGVAILALSDRAPDVLVDMLRPVLALSANAADRLDVRSPDWFEWLRNHPDETFHVVQWAALAALAGVAARRITRIGLIAMGLFAVSILLEAAQSEYSATRSFSIEDILANAVGIAVGMAIAIVITSAAAAVNRHRASAH